MNKRVKEKKAEQRKWKGIEYRRGKKRTEKNQGM